MSEISYARAADGEDQGLPLDPVHWSKLEVVDLDTGEPVSYPVVEVDTVGGWLVRYKPGANGKGIWIDRDKGEAIKERIYGRFAIRPMQR